MKTNVNISIDVETWIEAKEKIPNISAVLNEYLKEYLDPENSSLSKKDLERELMSAKAKVMALETKHGKLEEKEKIEIENNQIKKFQEKEQKKLIEAEKKLLIKEEKARLKRVARLKENIEEQERKEGKK